MQNQQLKQHRENAARFRTTVPATQEGAPQASSETRYDYQQVHKCKIDDTRGMPSLYVVKMETSIIRRRETSPTPEKKLRTRHTRTHSRTHSHAHCHTHTHNIRTHPQLIQFYTHHTHTHIHTSHHNILTNLILSLESMTQHSKIDLSSIHP